MNMYVACENPEDGRNVAAAVRIGADLLPHPGEDTTHLPEEERARRIRAAGILIIVAVPWGPVVEHALGVAEDAGIPVIHYIPPHRVAYVPYTDCLTRLAQMVRDLTLAHQEASGDRGPGASAGDGSGDDSGA